jgi:hypothetical protein
MFIPTVLNLGGKKKLKFVLQQRRGREIFDIQLSSRIYRRYRD